MLACNIIISDDIPAQNVSAVSAPPFWRNLPVSEHGMEVSQPSSVNDCNLGDMNSRPLDMDVKLLVQKSSKIERKNGRCTKTSGVAQIESSKRKPGLHAVNGISPEVVASSSASRNTSGTSYLIILDDISLFIIESLSIFLYSSFPLQENFLNFVTCHPKSNSIFNPTPNMKYPLRVPLNPKNSLISSSKNLLLEMVL